MSFTGRGGFEDTSDRSSWARSVESRLSKVVARIQSADIVDRAVTSAKLALNIPLGELGYTSVSTTESGVGDLTDLAGMSVTFTVGTNRKVLLIAAATYSYSDATTAYQVMFMEGASFLGRHFISGPLVSGFQHGYAAARVTPSAGAHTYKLQADRYAGGGTLTRTADGSAPSFIAVYDMGGT